MRADGGERRTRIRRNRKVVVSHNSKILWHRQLCFVQCEHCAEGDSIIAGEKCCWARITGKYPPHRIITALSCEIALRKHGRIKANFCGLQRLAIALETEKGTMIVKRSIANMGDSLMA